jgi:regulator of sigma E protease
MLNVTLAVLTVVFGLGFVIFIHELGHFLLAKWNGVKVEKFAIGFDIFNLKLYSKRIGETTYVLGALPLGGYVKMLGEDPGESRETDEARDPRAFHNKSVGARMAIISAGVLMNVLFGWLCFAYIYMRGKLEVPPIIGTVIAGMPAYEAGIRPGDQVLSVDGRAIKSYSELQKATIFSGPGQTLRLEMKRPGSVEPVTIEVSPRLKDGGLSPTLGITSSTAFELASRQPYLAPPGLVADSSALPEVPAGGTVVAAGPAGGPLVPLESQAIWDDQLARLASLPLEIEVELPRGRKAEPRRTRVTLPPTRFVDPGMRMTPGPIVAIRRGSIAESAGFRVGDKIVSVDGNAGFDPMRLPSDAYARGLADEAMTFEVERAASGGDAGTERVTLTATPDDSPPWVEDIWPDEPLEVPGLGLGFDVMPTVAAVAPGSPAEAKGIKPGEEVRSVLLSIPDFSDEEGGEASTKKRRIVLDGKRLDKDDVLGSWPAVFDLLQAFPQKDLELIVSPANQAVHVTPVPVEGWFYPRRGLQFVALTSPLPPQGIASALALGWGEVTDSASDVYFIIRGLIQRTLSKDAVGGPIKIFDWGYKTARRGLDAFLPFLAMLSVNLAVINFLPIPPLDGGQLLFLICEKIRGRPVPEKFAGPVMLAGLVFILLLFVVVNLNDVMSYFGPR